MEEETKNPLSLRQTAEMALNCALKEPGVKETLSETEKEMLKILGVDIEPKTEPAPKP